MASPKSDEELLAESGQKRTDTPAERPGVYVQVVGTPRRRKSSSNVRANESGSHMVDDVSARPRTDSQVRRGPGPMGMGTGSAQRIEPVARNQSEVRERERVPSEPSVAAHVPAPTPSPAPVSSPMARDIVEIQQPLNDPRAESENTNHRADIVRVSAPPVRYSSPPTTAERLSAPSVLDAKASLRTDPPAPARTPWALITGVAIMSAIIAAAGVVALQEWRHNQEAAASVSAPAPRPAQVVAPKPASAPAAVATPAAPAPAPVEAAPAPVEAAPAPVEAAPVPAAVAPAPAAAEAPAPTPAPVAAPTPTPPVAAAPVVPESAKPAPAAVAKPAKPAAMGAPQPSSRTASAPEAPVDNEPDAIPKNPYPANAAPVTTP